MILTQLPGQEIQFELFDKDIDQDDFLGRCIPKILSVFHSCGYYQTEMTDLPPFCYRFKLNLRDIISAQFIDTVSTEAENLKMCYDADIWATLKSSVSPRRVNSGTP